MYKSKYNHPIKKCILQFDLNRFEVAHAMGISESKFNKMLLKPLTEENEEKVLHAICDLVGDVGLVKEMYVFNLNKEKTIL